MNMIVVTGGLGFIGYNLIKKLNSKGYHEIIIVENIYSTRSLDIKLNRLKKIKFVDLIDREDFISNLSSFRNVECIFHLGACTNTTEKDFNYLFYNNYQFTKNLIDFCSDSIKLIYSSSASVYGNKYFAVNEESQPDPLNYYAYSKFLADNYFLNCIKKKNKTRIVGLRYFNVYGPYEENKGNMSSVVFKFFHQLKKDGKLYLFEGSENFRRDFIYVEDVVDINLFFMTNEYSGIYNCGTGKSYSFVDIARIMIDKMGFGSIEFIPFPKELKNQYQEFTQADNSKLLSITKMNFTDIEEGIERYLKYLVKENG